ncbi:MAG: hypothetical protein PHT58_00760 [Eubacteriales bacterium]|nr:hypothetical protein [Eubacteriales bacterium]
MKRIIIVFTLFVTLTLSCAPSSKTDLLSDGSDKIDSVVTSQVTTSEPISHGEEPVVIECDVYHFRLELVEFDWNVCMAGYIECDALNENSDVKLDIEVSWYRNDQQQERERVFRLQKANNMINGHSPRNEETYTLNIGGYEALARSYDEMPGDERYHKKYRYFVFCMDNGCYEFTIEYKTSSEELIDRLVEGIATSFSDYGSTSIGTYPKLPDTLNYASAKQYLLDVINADENQFYAIITYFYADDIKAETVDYVVDRSDLSQFGLFLANGTPVSEQSEVGKAFAHFCSSYGEFPFKRFRVIWPQDGVGYSEYTVVHFYLDYQDENGNTQTLILAYDDDYLYFDKNIEYETLYAHNFWYILRPI